MSSDQRRPVASETAVRSAGRAEMGRRGCEWVLANATRESLAKRYLDVMEALVAGRGAES